MIIENNSKVVDAGVELPELIVCAAQSFDGFVIPSVRHFCPVFWILHDKILDVGISLAYVKDIQEGFITNRGRFVSREEAYAIATDNNQIIRLCPTVSNKLYSEMLY